MTNSVLKSAVANFCRLITPQTHPGQWAGQVCRLLKFQLCMVCGSDFSWIKVQSASETVDEAFNYSLKLRSVLW